LKSKNKTLLQYIIYPFVFAGIITAISYAVGGPVLSLARANLNMIITKGAPSYSNEYNNEFSDLFVETKDIEPNDIQIPEYGAHYGNILCERIEMRVPLYYGDSDAVLEKGAGHYIASGLPGEGRQILIGGHDSIYFAPLAGIEIGDIVSVNTNYGNFKYQVTETRIADAKDTTTYSLLENGEKLILYTCYPFGELVGERNERFFVYCEKLDN
jgi:sortase A